jgi:hypothetical protein
MVDRQDMRASDDDRARTAERLRRATQEGRLPTDEFDERLGQALRARTYAELDAIVADLPVEPGLLRRPRRSRLTSRRPRLVERVRRAGIARFRPRGRALIAGAMAAAAVAVPVAVDMSTSAPASSRCWWYTNPASANGKSAPQLAGMCAGDRPPHGHARVDLRKSIP